jgi:hypothetical protein
MTLGKIQRPDERHIQFAAMREFGYGTAHMDDDDILIINYFSIQVVPACHLDPRHCTLLLVLEIFTPE